MVSSVRPSDWVLPTVVGRFAAIFALHVLVLAPAVHSMEHYGFSAEWARSHSTVFWLVSRAFAGGTPSLSLALQLATINLVPYGSKGAGSVPMKSSLAAFIHVSLSVARMVGAYMVPNWTQ